MIWRQVDRSHRLVWTAESSLFYARPTTSPCALCSDKRCLVNIVTAVVAFEIIALVIPGGQGGGDQQVATAGTNQTSMLRNYQIACRV